MDNKNIFGFGYEPQECAQHFLVVIPRRKEANIAVYERYNWDEGDTQVSELPGDPNGKYRCKISLSREKWNLVKMVIESQLNSILKKTGRRSGKFVIGNNPVERLLGKEMMVLLWAIEDCDKSVIPDAIRNWQGLSREERWWLFTMTNAATGDMDNKRGWRVALRYAITENPVIEEQDQGDLFAGLRGE